MIRELPSDREPAENGWFDAGSEARCPPMDLLFPAYEHVMPEPLGAGVREHVQACEACRLLVDVLDPDRSAEAPSSAIAREPAPVASRHRPFWWALGAAAIVLLAAGAGLFQASRGLNESRTPAVTASRGDRVVPAPVYLLALQKPALRLPESVLVMRGSDLQPYALALVAALEPYRRNDFPAAERGLAAVSARFPDEPHAFFYRGASLLLSGRAVQAIEPLTRAARLSQSDRWLADEASWHLAIASERASGRPAMKQALSALCSSGTVRREQACRALEQLP